MNRNISNKLAIVILFIFLIAILTANACYVLEKGAVEATINDKLVNGKSLIINVKVNLDDDGFKASKYMARDLSYGIYKVLKSYNFSPNNTSDNYDIKITVDKKTKKVDKKNEAGKMEKQDEAVYTLNLSKKYVLKISIISLMEKQDEVVYTLNWQNSSDIATKSEAKTTEELTEKVLDNLSKLTNKSFKDVEWVDIPDKNWKITKYEITSAQFFLHKKVIKEKLIQFIIDNNLSTLLEGSSWKSYRADAREKRYCTCDSMRYFLHPMNCINYIASDLFCKEIGAELPNSKDWEYIYHAGTDTKYWWGNEFDGNRAVSDVDGNGKWMRYFHIDEDKYKNYLPTIKMTFNNELIDDEDLYIELIGGTASIDSTGKRANKFGVYDMAGNVWEWMVDTLPGNLNRMRGGAWDYYNADWYTATHDSGGDPKDTYPNVGFRCIKK